MDYIGEELNLFSHAVNWKNYYGQKVKPYLGSRVLEVGAGIGSTTEALCSGNHSKWVCVEPDPVLGKQIETKISNRTLPGCCEYVEGTVDSLPEGELYDSILYMDVIEHIKDDKSELAKAADRLAPGGYLIVLVPAHNFLFSEFDKKIGHFRRYNKRMLKTVKPQNVEIQLLQYLDSLGCLLSIANKLILKQSYPKLKQILLWDRKIVPLSKSVDKLLFNQVGKSVLFIAKRK